MNIFQIMLKNFLKQILFFKNNLSNKLQILSFRAPLKCYTDNQFQMFLKR